jgi:hypothetical protein
MQQSAVESKTPTGLYVTGGLLVLGALGSVALRLAGRTELADPLTNAGLTPGLLGIGGACLIGLGAATRASLGRPRTAQLESGQPALANGIHALHAQLELLQAQLAQLLASSLQGTAPAAQSATDHTNALFRVAASLDQLGARLDTGFKTHFHGVDEKLNILARVLTSLRDQQQPSSRSGVNDTVAVANPAGSTAHSPDAPAARVAHATPTVPSALVDLPPPAALPTRQVPPPPSLGILDQLDDPEALQDTEGEPTVINLDGEAAEPDGRKIYPDGLRLSE